MSKESDIFEVESSPGEDASRLEIITGLRISHKFN